LLVLAVGIEVVKEGLEELRNAVFNDLLFENFADDKLSNEFDVAQNFLFGLSEEVILGLFVFKFGEFFHLFIKRVLNLADKEEFERVLFLFASCLKFEAFGTLLTEIIAQLSISAGVLGLIPSLLDCLLNQYLTNFFAFDKVEQKIFLDLSQVFGDNQIQIVNDFFSGQLYFVKSFIFFHFSVQEAISRSFLFDQVSELTSLEGLFGSDYNGHFRVFSLLVAKLFCLLSMVFSYSGLYV